MQDLSNQPAMEQEWGFIKKLSADEQERFEAEDREKALRDYISRIHAAKKEGHEEGREEGREEGHIEERVEVAIKMSQDNLPIESISKYTRLTYEEISEIIRKNNIDYKFKA